VSLSLFAAQLDDARKRIAELTAELAMAQHVAEMARRWAVDAEDALRGLALATAGGQDARVAHLRATLLDYEAMLATCREHHGTNSRPGHYPIPPVEAPHPLAVCEWCGHAVDGPLADCARVECRDLSRQLAALAAGIGRRRLDDDPDIARETAAKRSADL
jgi:hypothetical protein